jgi:peptidoglycan LD-endopeptidase LytH
VSALPHPRWTDYADRAARGVEPCPQHAVVASWLRDHRGGFAPIVEPDPRTSPVVVFDFGRESVAWEHDELAVPMLAADEIVRRMAEAGAEIGLGRYDEERLVYSAAQFRPLGGEPRTLHLGVDVFQPAGAPVFAPLDGFVHSFADNDLPLDYGPTVLLQHTPDGCPPFFTLYGHLSRASLDGLEEGQRIERGQRVGTLGDVDENGGWAPHLHVQLILDLLDRRGDFPGVGTASERSVWLSLCPDPNLLLAIPALET